MTILLSVTISCSQALGIIQRIQKVVGLSEVQKTEIVSEIRRSIPFCPIKIKQDERRNKG